MVEKIQEKIQTTTSVITPTGAVTAGLGALTLNEWLAIGGFLLAFFSFAINWYYQHKRYLIEKEKMR